MAAPIAPDKNSGDSYFYNYMYIFFQIVQHLSQQRTCSSSFHFQPIQPHCVALAHIPLTANMTCSIKLSPVVISVTKRPMAPIMATRPTTVSTDGRLLSRKEFLCFLGVGNSNQEISSLPGFATWSSEDVVKAICLFGPANAVLASVHNKATILERMKDRLGMMDAYTLESTFFMNISEEREQKCGMYVIHHSPEQNENRNR